MRPVRFVALSEDGQAMVLTDEVGHLLSLPIDERISAMLRPDRPAARSDTFAGDEAAQLAPRDIQARIRSGESAEDVARIAGVPVDRVLRYAGPVLQERAMLAQQARRTRLKTSERGATLAEVVDSRLSQHGVELEKIAWDAYRRDDGTWRIVATWPSGRANATAVWEMDKARQLISPHDDMAQYLCGGPSETPRGAHEVVLPRADVSGHEPIFGGRDARPTRDPIRNGRDALIASLERPLGTPAPTRSLEPNSPLAAPMPAASAAATGEAPIRRSARAFYEDERESPMDTPAVPSLAVLRPRRTAPDVPPAPDRPIKRGPNWDDILFGPAPAKDA
ncbi:MAG TPA: septation protein SepH [Micromonosporaceae bacterium]|jgi:hypothetical protein